MKNHKSRLMAGIIVLCLVYSTGAIRGQEEGGIDERELLKIVHSISSHKLFDYVRELALDKYGGRLTGTQEYLDSADWVSRISKNGESPRAVMTILFSSLFPILTPWFLRTAKSPCIYRTMRTRSKNIMSTKMISSRDRHPARAK